MSRKGKGFTLVELVAVIGLLAVVIPLIFSVYISGNNIYAAGLRIENVETNGRLALEQLSEDIKTSKVLIGTLDLKNATRQGVAINNTVYSDNTAINRNYLIAYIETYNGKRYLYAFRNGSDGKKELHRMTLVDQDNNHYIISADSFEQSLSNADKEKFDASDSSHQEVVMNFTSGKDINSYVNNLPVFSYSSANKCLMYDNNGEDCYLVDTVLKFKRKLNPTFYPDLTMPVDKTREDTIGRYMDSVVITNNKNSAEISISLSSGSSSKSIDTSVNILNQ